MIHLNFRDVTERRTAEEHIRSSLRDKELLLQEIHHRVKNNLQVISSILSLQSRYVQNEQALQALHETRNRVLSIATIHEMLYRAKGLSRIEMGEYIRKLAANLFDTYGIAPGSLDLQVEAGSASLAIDKAIPCGLIINELLSNCLKHAGMAGREGRIDVRLNLERPGFYVLSVKDNGAGLPPDLDLTTLQSLGLQMVQLLAEQLNGSAEFLNRGGLEAIIRFPGAGVEQ
jgi:two-component sensor histidine kinase